MILSIQMNRFIKIGEAAKVLGVSIQTLRRWEETGYLVPDRRSKGKTRYYDLNQLIGKKILVNDLTVAYARVSSHDQKEDLKRQAEVLATYCTRQGWNFQVIQDLGSGMNQRSLAAFWRRTYLCSMRGKTN
jgi:putative resolvase